MKSLASDNWSGLCPESLGALLRANEGSAPPYGADDWSNAASDRLRAFFDHDADIFFVSSGTAGNSLVLAHLLKSFEAVLCHEAAHIHLDECGSPGFFGHGIGVKPVGRHHDGRITLSELQEALESPKDLRFQPPGVLSLTQSTERGVLYLPEEIRALNLLAKQHGLACHMDGARLLMATEALKTDASELTWKAGVDVVVLGASKLGGGQGDAVIFFNKNMAAGFSYRLKQAGQISSKMRLMTAPWIGLLEADRYRAYAGHALEMAKQLEKSLVLLDFKPWVNRETNAVFVMLPEQISKQLRQHGWMFHTILDGNVTRLMTGWDTQHQVIEAFVADIRDAMGTL